MGSIPNPGGAMHVHTNVTSRSDQRFTGVHSHSHPQWLTMRPVVGSELPLCLGNALDGIQRTREGDKEGIALRGDFYPVPFLYSSAQNLVIILQHPGILVA